MSYDVCLLMHYIGDFNVSASYFVLDRVSLCGPDCSGTHSVAHAVLERRAVCLCLPASGIKACATTARHRQLVLLNLKLSISSV